MTTGWATRVVAEFWQVSEAAVRQRFHRAGITPVGREPGRRGQNLWNEADVRACTPSATSEGTH